MSKTFKDLGVVDELCEACKRVGWTTPSQIQIEAIPYALQGRDVIGLAKTGSGKTAAFAIPMIQALLAKPKRLFGVVITPTRELAFQIKDHVQALGSKVGVEVAVLCGGMDMRAEKLKLKSKPHIVVATPGRLLDHLKTTKGFTMEYVKYLVFDEADRILGVDLEEHMNDILRVLPQDRRTMLFSATMNKSTERLERASLINPVMVKVNQSFQTVETLTQYMKCVMSDKEKIANLVWFLNDLEAQKDTTRSFIIFCSSRIRVLKVHISLTQLSFNSLPLYGKMTQDKRLAALQKFKIKQRNILVATDVASRGLDIPDVDWVVNFDLPIGTKDYIHRVGRTARAGKEGKAITFSIREEVAKFFSLEKKLRVEMKEFPITESEVEIMLPSVLQAEHMAMQSIANMDEKAALKTAQRTSSKTKRKKSKPTKESGGWKSKKRRV